MKTDKKNENWNVSITNKFIKLVSQFRSLTTDPIISSSKWIIYGIAIFLCVLAAIIFFRNSYF